VRVVAPADPDTPVTLVRPDGYAAWTGGRDGVRAALTAWCGAPVPVHDADALAG
jgi:hypothetical protein